MERCKISEEPERESTNSPLMKSLVNLMVGISREKLDLPLEEGRVIFVCFPKKLESNHKTTRNLEEGGFQRNGKRPLFL